MPFPLPPPMRRALDLAAEAAAAGEVPVGAVITRGEEIVAEAIGQPRLDGCTLWVTLEPCAMCAAAASVARLDSVKYGADDPKGGGVVHGARIFAQPTCHHRPDVLGGIGETESAELLKRFFGQRRS